MVVSIPGNGITGLSLYTTQLSSRRFHQWVFPVWCQLSIISPTFVITMAWLFEKIPLSFHIISSNISWCIYIYNARHYSSTLCLCKRQNSKRTFHRKPTPSTHTPCVTLGGVNMLHFLSAVLLSCGAKEAWRCNLGS